MGGQNNPLDAAASNPAGGEVKANKLKRRRWRRMRDALAAYKTEASDWKSLYLERTAEIASLRSQRLLVPMPVIVPAEIYNQFKGVREDHQLCKRCNDGLRGGCSSCSYSGR